MEWIELSWINVIAWNEYDRCGWLNRRSGSFGISSPFELFVWLNEKFKIEITKARWGTFVPNENNSGGGKLNNKHIKIKNKLFEMIW